MLGLVHHLLKCSCLVIHVQLQVTVEVLNGKVTCEGTLLSADLSSNIAFIKFTSPGQQKVAPVGKIFGISAVAVGCPSRGRGLQDTDFNYCQAFTGYLKFI